MNPTPPNHPTTTPQCDENWHIFDGGLPKPGQACKCGKKVATAKLGTLADAAKIRAAAGKETLP